MNRLALARLVRLLAGLLPGLVLLAPSPGRAETIDGGCISLALVDAQPAEAEWTFFVGGGGGARDIDTNVESAVGLVRVGGSVTMPLASLGEAHRSGGPAHLRLGPYLLAETTMDGLVVDGGLELTIGQTSHAQWGTFGIRIGGGAGVDPIAPLGHVSATLTYGVLSAPSRYSERGACDAPAPVDEHAYVSGARLFVTARAPLGDDRGFAIVAGVEIEPTFFLPPYSWRRLAGASP